MNDVLFSIFWRSKLEERRNISDERESRRYNQIWQGSSDPPCRIAWQAPICRLIFLFIVHISVFVIGMSLFRIRPTSESGTHVYSLERARTRGAFKHGWSATKPLRARNICYLRKTQPYCVFRIEDTHTSGGRGRAKASCWDRTESCNCSLNLSVPMKICTNKDDTQCSA